MLMQNLCIGPDAWRNIFDNVLVGTIEEAIEAGEKMLAEA